MSEEEREAFLAEFAGGRITEEVICEDNGAADDDGQDLESLVGFCVLGGIFAEGIDLQGDNLIGSIIVGTGIPMVCDENEIIKDYFDLNRDYNKIDKEIIKKDSNLKNMIDKCKNYRILNQDPFEMGISYIISQNNNVKRISKSINELCKNYGKKVVFNNNDYYLFL